MELEQQVTQEAVVFRPKKRDSAGRDEQQVRAMDTPPASGSKALYPGSKEHIAIGGNKVMPPPISAVDEAYAATIAEHHADYPRALYHRAFRRERDAAGKIVPGGEVTPLATADPISPNYPLPANVAQRNGVKGVLSTSEGSPAIIGQHLYRTCMVPAGWQPGDKINLAACKKEEETLLKAAWVRTPGELNLPQPKTVEQESDE
jgi:hypothetical protein